MVLTRAEASAKFQLPPERMGDLVVVSTRGHDSVSDAVLGSTAERAVRYAACPVLVV